MILPVKKKDSRPRGFSLLELLVVMIIMGILAGVAGPSVGRFMDSLAFKKQSGRIMAAVRYARLKAVTNGRAVIMTLDEDNNLRLNEGAVQEERDLKLSADDTIGLNPEIIKFSPDGHATPATISFTRGDRSEKIIIDSLSGLPVVQ
ncbi:MAG TPA: type II secretion system protein GspH [Desulfobacterales bacterium]|nr:type II secretion system protein GspH [Desulfobacterales bacterium]